ncbi:hypothetical protein ABGN05_12075 [Aquibium sp. LZ166]|uniref:Uncharacterized protein n=1 Tax=Aquibium pacificus TaxID=3153579 RepID=A0ABV3SJB9_9HYPH
MSVSCHIKIGDGDGVSAAGWLVVRTFQEVPRVGEFVAFSRDGKRDEAGVLLADLYRVQRIIHTAATDLDAGMVTLDVIIEQEADRTLE